MAGLEAQGITIQRERTTKCWRVKQRILTGAEVLEDSRLGRADSSRSCRSMATR